MRTSVNLLKMFHSEAKIIKDYAWLEENLGQLVPMEVVVRVPQEPSSGRRTRSCSELQQELAAADTTAARKAEIEKIVRESQFQLPFLERMELAARVQNLIEEEFGPDRPQRRRPGDQRGDVRPPAARSRRQHLDPSEALDDERPAASPSRRLPAQRLSARHDNGRTTTELWRVSLRVGATKGVDYGAFVSELQQTVEPVIAAQRQRVAILRQIDQQRRQARPARRRS